MGAHNYANVVSAAAPATLATARRLHRIVVGTGAATETVTVTDSATGAIAIIDAASPGVYDFDIRVAGLIVTTSDDALDVTVVWG